MQTSDTKLDSTNRVQGMYKLSPMQEGMLYNSLSGNGSKTYFIQYVYRAEGELDPVLLQKSLVQLAKRHEILRTQFIYERVTNPLQAVMEEPASECVYEDLIHLTDEQQEQRISEVKLEDREHGFLPSDAVLMRIRIFRQQPDRFTLLWSFHHILMDAWCVPIVTRELFTIYEALKHGETPDLSYPQPFSRYIAWLERCSKQQSIQYWGNLLEGYEQLATIPAAWREDGAAGLEKGYLQQEIMYKLDSSLTAQLAETAKLNGVTLNTLFQAMWGVLLQRYNSTDDVVFGAVVSGRPPEVEGIEEMIGLFINTIPIRIQTEKDMRFDELLAAVQERTSTSLQHSYLPLYEVLSKFSAATGNSHLLNHLFIFENYPVAPASVSGNQKSGLTLHMDEEFEQADFDFNFVIVPGDEMRLVFRFNANKYDPEMIGRINGHYLAIARQVVDETGIRIGDIDLLTVEDREMLKSFDRRELSFSKPEGLMDGFETNVAFAPEKIAVLSGEGELSYAELSRRADQIAQALGKRGIGANDKVGCYMGRSPLLLASLLGIWKCGAAYVPLDPAYPQERIAFMFEDSGMKLVLTDAEHADGLPEEIVRLDASKPEAGSGDSRFIPDNERCLNDLAYLIYTSGSTGLPKGVMVDSANVLQFFASVTERLKLPPDSRILCSTSVSFDIFLLESLLPLWKGHTVILADDTDLSKPEMLNHLIIRNRATLLQTTPSLLQRLLLASEAKEALAQLAYVLVGGEALPAELLQSVQAVSEARIFNMYGPTEATVWATAAELSKEERVRIGLPLDGTAVVVVGPSGRQQPVGIKGEICIGGPLVAQGYWKRPELTAERFCPLPADTTISWYKTGDMGVILPDGSFMHAGRMDNQIKMFGHRIELGEIEACVSSYAGVRQACVLLQHSKSGQPVLRAFIALSEDRQLEGLKAFVSGKLPRQMVPGDWVLLDNLPLTPNGKLDRRALSDLSVASHEGKESANQLDTELVNQIMSLWKELLGIEEIGLDQNFFDLGGNSIHSVKVEIALETIGYDIEPLLLYKYGTINELVQHLNELKPAAMI